MTETSADTTVDDLRRHNAAAGSTLALMADGDLTPSEDETAEGQRLELETVQSTIGVSLGEQQTRLISPRTPAAEKAAALDDVDGGGLFDGWHQPSDGVPDTTARLASPTRPVPPAPAENSMHNADTRRSRSREKSGDVPMGNATSGERLPSPWRAGPKTFSEKVSDHRALWKQHLQGGRRRASSSGAMAEAVRKYMPFTLPTSLSKSYKDLHFYLPSFSTLSVEPERARTTQTAAARRRRVSLGSGTASSNIPQHDGGVDAVPLRNRHEAQEGSNSLPLPRTSPKPRHQFSNNSTTTVIAASAEGPREYTTRLRRSTSEGSLTVYRTRSFASSLGDDSRFESVNAQVNSRMKALKDSWQDSNFKLPSPSFPNFNFVSREDLFKVRNGSVTPRSRQLEDGVTARTGLLASIPASILTTRDTSTRGKRASSSAGAPEDETHPFFNKALQEIKGDLVVLGGYRGSILRSAEPPNRQLWVPIKVGLNLRKVDLEVPLDPEADERMEKSIYPSGMLTHIGPVDISRRLFKRLNACDNAKSGELRVHNYGYDWRLSPHFLSRRMIQFLEGLPCNQPGVPAEKRGAYIIAHSLGGLITRHAINLRPDLVAGVVYAGVPQRCVNILGPFHKGDDVMFSSRVLTAQVNFSIRTSFALLPLDGKCFINKYTKEEYPVDFFDVNTWKEHRLSPCIAVPLPRPDQPKDGFRVSSLMNAVSQALPTIPRKASFSLSKSFSINGNPLFSPSSAGEAVKNTVDNTCTVASKAAETSAQTAGMEPTISSSQTVTETSPESNPATHVTIPYDQAVEYLGRVLAETKKFKQELAHQPRHTASNTYPPIALIYGKSTPTVYGAKVESRAAIKRADVYDDLAFASGDGVVLARAAMVPEGYSVAKGGVVASERGHVTLLGDLEAVGKCLCAVIKARKKGVGVGLWQGEDGEKGENGENAKLRGLEVGA